MDGEEIYKNIIHPGDKYIIYARSKDEVNCAPEVKKWHTEAGSKDPHRCLQGGTECFICQFESKSNGDKYGKDDSGSHRSLKTGEECPTCHWERGSMHEH